MSKRSKLVAIYKKNAWMKYIPVVGNILENFRLYDSDISSKMRVEALSGKIYYYRNFFRLSPRKYSGGLILNILGFQILRTVNSYFKWKVRQSIIRKGEACDEIALKELNDNGVVVLRNFFSFEEIAILKKDFSDKSLEFVKHFEEFHEGLILPSNSIRPWTKPIGSDIAKILILGNQKLKDTLQAVSGHKMRLTPEISYLQYKSKISELGMPQVDGQDRLHCDVVYPSFKVFIYLDDTDETNGAFRFCPGSHKISLSRIWFEYKLSIRYFRSLRHGEYKPTQISEEEKKKLKMNEKAMVGKAGSVIIFNTMGFHRRGDFTNANKPERKVILVNYRFLDSIVNVIGLKQE